MGITVFAEGMGFFHKGSGGKGVAPADVCLSPPPPPAGPVPVPYVNNLSAADLSKGSKTVKIDGEPTALEDASEVSTSMGDEPGTQGGNVVTHKTKGKGFFMLWSFTVKVEGKGVCRHGDPMGQNSGTPPAGTVDAQALVNFKKKPWVKPGVPCARQYPGHISTTPKQRAKVAGKPCWVPKCKSKATRADHQPPLSIAWAKGGCHNSKEFKKWAKLLSSVKPHCAKHSSSQGGHLGKLRGKTIAQTLKKVNTFLRP
jgi:uncharacterized Zn-binding protein involved in type VI secretion